MSSARVDQGGPNVFGLEVGVTLQNRFGGRAGRKHAENVLDGDAYAPDDRLAAEDPRVDRDALEKLGFVHGIYPHRLELRPHYGRVRVKKPGLDCSPSLTMSMPRREQRSPLACRSNSFIRFPTTRAETTPPRCASRSFLFLPDRFHRDPQAGGLQYRSQASQLRVAGFREHLVSRFASELRLAGDLGDATPCVGDLP